MTVSATEPYVAYAGAGTTGPFAIPFRFLADDDLAVLKTDAAGVETALTGNTITGADEDDGGQLYTAAPVAAGDTLRIYRDTTRAQTAQYVAGGPFPAATHERALDKAMLVDQEQDRDLGRAVLAPLGEAGSVLPKASARRGLVAMFANTALAPMVAGALADVGGYVLTLFGIQLGQQVDAAGARGLLRIRNYLTPKDMGAVEDGIANDATPIFNANATGKPILFTAATTRIATELYLSVPVEVAAGARIKVDGVVLHLTGEFAAPLMKVFDCVNGGSVVFAFGVLDASYAEWWGANADGVTDSTAAINASLKASSKTVLLRGTYKVTSAVVVSTDNTSLVGAGAGITILSSNSLTDDVVRVAGSGSVLVTNTVLRGFSTARTVTPTTPTAGLEYSGGAGVRTSKASRFFYDDVSCYNDVIGFYFNNTAAGTCENILAVKDQAGVVSDKYYGFWNDGSIASVTPGLTPNASLRLNNATASVTGFAGISRGLYGTGAIADWFLFQPESGGCTTSLDLAPTGGYYDAIDVHVTQPVFDNVKGVGIKITATSVYGAVNIIGGYVSLGANGATTCYGVDVSGAVAVKLIGLQVMNVLGATSAVGVRATNGRRVTVEGCTFKDVTFGVVLATPSYCRIVNNSMERNGAIAATGYGVSVTGGSNNTFDLDIGGDTNTKYTVGIMFDGTTASNYVNLTGVALGPCVNKMSINGTTVTSVGLNGTHWISGTLT